MTQAVKIGDLEISAEGIDSIKTYRDVAKIHRDYKRLRDAMGIKPVGFFDGINGTGKNMHK